MRGYFGIGIYQSKTVENVGTLWRSAHNFGAKFIFTIGRRYKKQASDTTKAWKSIPLYNYETLEQFYENMPHDCRLFGVEQCERSEDLKDFQHPEQAIYLLGAEDHGLTAQIIEKCHGVISIDTPMCLNVAVAGSVLMYDRVSKLTK